MAEPILWGTYKGVLMDGLWFFEKIYHLHQIEYLLVLTFREDKLQPLSFSTNSQ